MFVGNVIIYDMMIFFIMFRLSVDILCVRFIFSIVFISVWVVEIGKFVFDVIIIVYVVVSFVVKLWFGVKCVIFWFMVLIMWCLNSVRFVIIFKLLRGRI